MAGVVAAVAVTRGTATALLLAIGLDLVAGEPPARLHPVVTIGNAIDRLTRHSPHRPGAALLYGGAMATAVPAAAGVTAAAIAWIVDGAPLPLEALALALALKPAFALRELLLAGRRVERALERDDLGDARTAVRALVSRPTDDLDAPLVAAAAIESLAENLGDGFAGPLLAFAVAGLPGAWSYRALNTLDSMVGYHGERFEWLGKASARLDDLANIVPARLTALTIIVAAPLAGGSAREAARMAWREHRVTASPNAGWPMAAAAGALGLRLEKQGHYTLNPEGRPPCACDIRRARRLVGAASGLVVDAALAAVALHAAMRSVRKKSSGVG